MRGVLSKALTNALAIWVLVVCAYISISPMMDRDTDPEAVRMQSGNTVLYDHRDTCWTTGPAKADIPTHVIMRIEDGAHKGKWFYGGSDYVDIALIDVFEKDNPRVFVKAFCI